MKPITPKEFKKAYGSGVPPQVIAIVNELIRKKATYEGVNYFRLSQQEVVDALGRCGFNRDEIFKKHYLDFEPEFRKAGWKVTWNKAAYFEPVSENHWIFEF